MLELHAADHTRNNSLTPATCSGYMNSERGKGEAGKQQRLPVEGGLTCESTGRGARGSDDGSSGQVPSSGSATLDPWRHHGAVQPDTSMDAGFTGQASRQVKPSSFNLCSATAGAQGHRHHPTPPPSPSDCAVLLAGLEVASPGLPGMLAEHGLPSISCELAVDAVAGFLDDSFAPSVLLLPLGSDKTCRVVESLRAHRRDLKAPAIVLVGQGPLKFSAVSKALASGVDDVLEGPLSPKDVAALWKAAWRRSMSGDAESCGHPGDSECGPSDCLAVCSVVPALERSQSGHVWKCGSSGGLLVASPEDITAETPKEQLLGCWLTNRQPCVDQATDRQRGLRVYFQILNHVDHHHQRHGSPLGASLLRNYAVNSEGLVSTCVCPSSSCCYLENQKLNLYLAPEGTCSGITSDVFTLGCILFSLLFRPGCVDVTDQVLLDLRNRILPTIFLENYPREAALVLSLLHPNPASRPSARQIARNTLFDVAREAARNAMVAPELLEQKAGSLAPSSTGLHACNQLWEDDLDLDRAEVVLDVLLQFMKSMETRLLDQHRVDAEQFGIVSQDLDNVLTSLQAVVKPEPATPTHRILAKRRRTWAPKQSNGNEIGEFQALDLLAVQTPDEEYVRHKDMDMFSCVEPQAQEQAREQQCCKRSEATVMDKWARLKTQLPVMETMYLQRWKESKSPQGPLGSASAGLSNHLKLFSDDLKKFSKYGSLTAHASLVYSCGSAASQMISSMSFGCNDEMFATAGTATRKIKLYQVQPLLRHFGDSQQQRASAAHYPIVELEAGNKLASICWNQYIRNYLVSADHGGMVQLWDTAKGELITTYSEHVKRVWSVDCSRIDPKRMLSAGDDGTVRFWSSSESCSAMTIEARAPIYSAQFSRTNANHVCVGSANYRAYVYDLRYCKAPLLQIQGHKKAVSYAHFMGNNQVVTASIDSTVKLWDIQESLQGGWQPQLRCCFRDHVNEKFFVGLDVRSDGYILCGSETNQVNCYYSGLPVPILKHTFADIGGTGRRPATSSVCWSSTSNLFLAANTAGSVDLLEMTSS